MAAPIATGAPAPVGARNGGVVAGGEAGDGAAPAVLDGHVVAVALAVVAGALHPTALAPLPAVALAAWGLVRRRNPWWWLLVALGAGLLASSLAGASWRAAGQVPTGRWQGVATVVGDPVPLAPWSGDPGSAASTVTAPAADAPRRVEAVLSIGGVRYITRASGAVAETLGAARGGERVWLDGGRMHPDWDDARRLAARHVVGELRVRTLRPFDAGNRLARSVNAVRRLVERTTAAHLPPAPAQLERALLYGDDRGLPDATVDAMRDAGLAHLTAVSGQQVVLLLAAARPLVRRLRPWTGWAATLALIGWFCVLTRFEPSVGRAAWMAALATTADASGVRRRPLRLLALAATAMMLVDPMVVRLPGWWMSVGATTGLIVLAPLLEPLLVGPDRLRRALAVTLGAQLGVAPALVAVFGVPPIVALPANLLAVPAAAVVTVLGFPVVLASAATDGIEAWLGGAPGPVGGAARLVAAVLGSAVDVLWVPVRLCLAWIVAVARLAGMLEPPAPWSAIAWAVLLAALAARGAVLVARYVRIRTAPSTPPAAPATLPAAPSTLPAAPASSPGTPATDPTFAAPAPAVATCAGPIAHVGGPPVTAAVPDAKDTAAATPGVGVGQAGDDERAARSSSRSSGSPCDTS